MNGVPLIDEIGKIANLGKCKRATGVCQSEPGLVVLQEEMADGCCISQLRGEK